MLQGLSERERTIQGEWFEIRERWRHPDQVAAYVCSFEGDRPFAVFVRSAADGLQNAVEGGVLEFKRTQVAALYAQLAEAAYDNHVFAELASLAQRAGAIQLVIAYQRALLAEALAPPQTTDATRHAADTTAEQRHINEIICDVRDIIAADPTAKLNASIKNIVVQLQRYRSEQATYQKLKAQADLARLELYARTFATTFRGIFDSIRRNYASYLADHDRAQHPPQRPGLVQASQTEAWRTLLFEQAKDITRVRGVALFALREQSGMRAPLVKESAAAEAVIARVEAERSYADEVGGGTAGGAQLLRNLALQIEHLLRHDHL